LNWEREPKDHILKWLQQRNIRTGNKQFIHFAKEVSSYLLKAQFDCLIFSDFRLFPIAILIGKLKKAKIFYDGQEAPVVTIAQKLSNHIKCRMCVLIRILRNVEILFLWLVDGIVTIPLRDIEIKRYREINKNTEVIRNFPSLPIQYRTIANYPEELINKRFIIYSGTIADYTGLYLYLNLMKRFADAAAYKDLILVLAGKLRGIAEDALRETIGRMRLQSSVIYLGWIPYEELLTLIRDAILGLALFDPNHEKFSYVAEGTSRKVYTYMACGIPVVSNTHLGAFVEREQCGVLVPYGDEHLFFEVRKLLDNNEKRRCLGINGKNAIITKYNWEKESGKIIRVFNNMWKRG
jgi:glycosyltransferase involved in cell wall biosynthesis